MAQNGFVFSLQTHFLQTTHYSHTLHTFSDGFNDSTIRSGGALLFSILFLQLLHYQ